MINQTITKMKKIAFVAVMALSLLAVMPAQAQLKLGVKGGLNLVNNSLSDLKSSTLTQLVDKDNYTGFFIGPKLDLNLGGLGFDAAVLYSQKGFALGEDDSFKLQSLVVPVNVRWGFGLGDLISVFVYGGPELVYNVNETLEFVKGIKSDNEEGIAAYTVNRSMFDVNLGVGATLFTHLQATLGYSIPCGQTADVKFMKKSDVNEVSTSGKNLSDYTIQDFDSAYQKLIDKRNAASQKVDDLKGRLSTGTLQISIAYLF